MAEISVDAYVVDSLMPDLVGHDRRAAAFVVYLFLYRESARRKGSATGVAMSHQEIASATGLSRSAVQGAIAHLEGRKLVASTRAHATAVPRHRVLRPWVRGQARL